MSKFPSVALTADVLVFREGAEALEILLIQRGNPPFKGAWALPGGFVDPDEDIVDAAARELTEETGLTAPWLIEVGTFGAPGRDPRGRTVSVAYLTLVSEGEGDAKAGDDAADARYYALDALPELAFDHDAVIEMGVDRLREALLTPAGLLTLFPGPIAEGRMDRLIAQILPDGGPFRERLLDLGVLDCLEGDGEAEAVYALEEEALERAYDERLLPF